MTNFSPQEMDEIHRLTLVLGDHMREAKLNDLFEDFKKWKRGDLGFSDLDRRIRAYSQRSLQGNDPVLSIADALAENRLNRSEVSDHLYNKIEIVVRLMKN